MHRSMAADFGMRRRDFLVATAGLAAACGRASEPRRAPMSTPPASMTQVLLVDAGGAGFGAYLAELLGVEGVVGIRRVFAASDGPASLDGAPAAIVYGDQLPGPWIEALDAFARRGGTVVAVLPPAAFLARIGIEDGGARDGAADVVLAHGGGGATLRLHLAGRIWRSGTGSVEGTFAGGSGPAAAATVRVAHGAGTVHAWAFDAVHNIALIRQGDPALANVDRDKDGSVRMIDAMRGWARLEKLDQPDADIYQRALVAPLLGHANPALGPGLSVDYFPGGARSVLIATSDAHGVGTAVLEQLIRRVEDAGGRLSLYYEPYPATRWRRYARRARWAAGDLPLIGPALLSEAGPPSPRLVAQWRARGHEFAPHPEVSAGLETSLEAAWASFGGEGYGTAETVRTHAILWSGWVETARVQRRLGVRMNLDAYAVGPMMSRDDGGWAHGHLIGSGLPARFVDTTGEVIDCYQQPTQIVDEQLLAVAGGGEQLSGAQAAAVAAEYVRRAIEGPPAALCGVFHADGFVPGLNRAADAGALLDGTLAACRQASVPIWTAAQWLAFQDARRTAAVVARTWDAPTRRLACSLALDAALGPTVSLILPAEVGGDALREVRLDGAPATLTPITRADRSWVRVVAPAGTVSLDARYGAA